MTAHRVQFTVRNTGKWSFAEYEESIEALRQLIHSVPVEGEEQPEGPQVTIVDEGISDDRLHKYFTIDIAESDGWIASEIWSEIVDKISRRPAAPNQTLAVELVSRSAVEEGSP